MLTQAEMSITIFPMVINTQNMLAVAEFTLPALP
jgi:hypothetical protein